jgi:outer membrane protein assembly factor BamD
MGPAMMPAKRLVDPPVEKRAGGQGRKMTLKARAARHSGLFATALLIAMAAAGLQGCASSNAAKVLNPDPPAKMYADADALLSAGRFDDAAKKFEDLDRDHPYAPEARRAMVMAAYAYYKDKKHPEAIAAARRYTTLHPGTKDAALAHHVIASAYFDDIKDPAHDQTAARRALAELKVLATRYPDSPYAKQAENRIRICEDSLAAAEMYIGRYYLKQGKQLAAINRFKVVIAEFQTTQHVEEALHRYAESYISLGIRQEAQAAVAVLGHNFPQSRWYQDGYRLIAREGLKPQADQGTWIGQQWRKIVPGTPAPSRPPASEPTVPPKEPAAPRTPAEDVPTASTTKSNRPMGLTRN